MRHLPARRQCPHPEAFFVSYESKTNEFTKRKTTVGGVLRFFVAAESKSQKQTEEKDEKWNTLRQNS